MQVSCTLPVRGPSRGGTSSGYQHAERSSSTCLIEGMGFFPFAAPNPEIMNSDAHRSQAAKGQGVLGAVGIGMQIPFEGASLLKETKNVDLCDVS